MVDKFLHDQSCLAVSNFSTCVQLAKMQMLEHMNIMYSMCQNKFLLHFNFILKVQQLKVCIKLKEKEWISWTSSQGKF